MRARALLIKVSHPYCPVETCLFQGLQDLLARLDFLQHLISDDDAVLILSYLDDVLFAEQVFYVLVVDLHY